MIRKRTTKYRLPLGIGFLIIGATLYLLFRSRQHLGFMLLDAIGLGSLTDSLRCMVADVHPAEFIIFALPDGLWTISYILIISHICRNQQLNSRLIWASVIPALGIISELLQAIGIVPGIFDFADLACYSLPLVVYIIYELGSSQYELGSSQNQLSSSQPEINTSHKR